MVEVNEGASHEIDLRDLFILIWRRKWLVGVIALTFAILALGIALYLPDLYRSETKLSPVNQTAGGDAAGLGGLAAFGSLVGVNVGSGEVAQVDLALAILRSRKFINDFVERRKLVVPLMAASGWNNETGKLLLEMDVYDSTKGVWLNLKNSQNSEPTEAEIYEKFKEILDVDRDGETGIVTVSVTYYSPEIAQRWLNYLIHDLNVTMRRDKMLKMDKALAFLERRIRENEIIAMNAPMQALYVSQLRERMLIDAQDEYALETVDPANLPSLKYSPNRKLIVIVGAFFGVLVGILIAIIVSAFKLPEFSFRTSH